MTMIPIILVIAKACTAGTVSPGTQMRADADPGNTGSGSSASPRIAGADTLVFASR